MKKDKSKFDTDKMTEFAKEHSNETFYGFSIDAGLLCLNSEEKFQKTLKYYINKYGEYDTEERIRDLKQNTGDWKYQGFAEFDKSSGFFWDEYNEHYRGDEAEENQLSTDYATSIDKVLENLKKSQILDLLKKSVEFVLKGLNTIIEQID